MRGRKVEGRHPGCALVHGHVGLSLEQALHDLGVPVLGGQVQGVRPSESEGCHIQAVSEVGGQ